MWALVISALVAMLLAGLFVWLAVRAWQSRRAVVKWSGGILAGLLAIVCLALGGVFARGAYVLFLMPRGPAPAVQVARTPEQTARGERLAHVCTGCHASTRQLPLDGGPENFIGGLGTLYAPNLTPDGPLEDWTDGEIARAIREGVDNEGRPLIIMPAEYYHGLSDADVQALVAFLRSQPAVDRPLPERNMGVIAGGLIGAGVFPTAAQAPISAPVTAPTQGPTADYGRYLAMTIGSCASCHGSSLTGGAPQGFTSVGPNIVSILANWTEAQFIQTIRTGTDPYGRTIDADQMPWPAFSAAFTDDELRALYAYVRSLPC